MEPPAQHDSEADVGSRSTLVERWERLPARFQLIGGWGVAFIVLLVFHVPFVLSSNITGMRALGYACGEALPFALLITLATQMERARKSQASSVDEHRNPPHF